MTKLSALSTRARATILSACVVAFMVLFLGCMWGLSQLPTTSVTHRGGGWATQNNEPFYVLLIGSDSRKGTALYTGKPQEHAQVDQHSDIMTLVRIDPETYTITLLTIPRDTVLPGETDKINSHLVSGNPEEVVEAAEKLTGVEISYYMMTTFTTFQNLVNDLGGIRVDVPKTITVPDPVTAKNVTVHAGDDQLLNGTQALVLARARKEYVTDQDALRQVNVRNIEVSLLQTLLKDDDSLSSEALSDVFTDTQTNIDWAHAAYILQVFQQHKDDVVLYEGTGPYIGDYRDDGLWVVDQNPEQWEHLMDVVDAGGDPREVLAPPAFDN